MVSESNRRRKRSFRLLLLSSFLLVAWLLSLLALDRYGMLDQAQPADAIVVLGSRVYPGGRPGPALARRADHAATLYEDGLAPAVICTGGLGPFPPTEAEAACARVEASGIPAGAIFLETRAHSTEENALYTAEIMRAQGWETAIISTDGYHAFRAVLLFRRAGITAYASPSQFSTYPMHPVERFSRLNRELAALGAYWLKTLLGLPITDFQP